MLTSLVLLYLRTERQQAFVAALGELAARRDLHWVCHEEYRSTVAQVIPLREDLRGGEDEPSFGVVSIVNWQNGRPVGRAMARTAWHGERMEWLS